MQIVVSSPARLSLLGGGTDLDSYSSRFGGICLNFAINIYQRITFHDNSKMYIGSSDNEFIKKALQNFPSFIGTLEMYFDEEISAGMGSSAAGVVGLISTVNKRLGLNLVPQEIAQKAYEIESLMWTTGKQDHYASAIGGCNVMEFTNRVNIIPIRKDQIEPFLPWLVLYYTGTKRKNNKIQDGFKELTKDQIETLHSIKEATIGAIDYLLKGEYLNLSYLMQSVWKLKKKSNEGIITSEVEAFYQKGLAAGAISAKSCGSGGGGYMLFFIEPTKRQEFITKMNQENIDFEIEWNGVSTRKI